MSEFRGIRHQKKRAFLAAFSQLGHIGKAAATAGMCRDNHALWMKADPEYSAAFALAEEMAIERLEAEADRRAVEGVDRPVFYKGEECGTIKEYSDTLLIFRLNALRPEKYRQRYQVRAEVTHHDGDSELDAEIAGLMAELGRPQQGSPTMEDAGPPGADEATR